MTTYRQCVLRRQNTQKVAWIPSEFAVEGKYLMIDEVVSEPGASVKITEHVNGWQVISAGTMEKEDQPNYGGCFCCPSIVMTTPGSRKRKRR